MAWAQREGVYGSQEETCNDLLRIADQMFLRESLFTLAMRANIEANQSNKYRNAKLFVQATLRENNG